MILKLIFCCAVAYLLGSVPFALVIGKVFYHTDIRRHGSGNLGGGNAGRVLGKRAGLSVMTLDILKVTLSVLLANLIVGGQTAMAVTGLAAAIGHCFPVFARFRGGKAVATMYGFLFGMWVVGGLTPWLFFFPLLAFLVILYLTKIIALASIGSALAVTLFAAFAVGAWPVTAALAVFSAMIIWRHRANLERIKNGNENKISWM